MEFFCQKVQIDQSFNLFLFLEKSVVIHPSHISSFKFSCFLCLGWKEQFLVILGGDQVKSGKPSPDL